jgi:cytochrome c556
MAGDVAGMKTQSRVVGGACKNCHDKYRVPEKK